MRRKTAFDAGTGTPMNLLAVGSTGIATTATEETEMDDNENPKPKRGSAAHEKRVIDFLKSWMQKLASAFNQEMTEARAAIYMEALIDIPVETLDAAFRNALHTCRFFPTIAEIRGFTVKQLEAADLMNAEKAWTTFKSLYGHWHPDVGFHGTLPKLDEAGEWAMRQIGGIARFHVSEIADEAFLRRDFIQAYQRYRETGGYLAPTREQAAELLAKLCTGELPDCETA